LIVEIVKRMQKQWNHADLFSSLPQAWGPGLSQLTQQSDSKAKYIGYEKDTTY